MGRLFPRYDLRNPEYFVAELNRHLEAAVRRNYNAFVLDLDRLAASIGRRFIQADALSPLSHGAILPFETVEPGWIGPLASLAQHYDIRTGSLFPDMVWAELTAMYRTVRKADPVRLVVIEVVDTLWKSREDHEPVRDGPPVDGWPAGIAEALIYLRKRGIQLAIVSDNDELFVREIWPGIFGDGLRIEDFAAIRINWRPKSENMAELLQELKIPSRSALFIDADPAEREAMRTAFQDMRILGAFPYYLKRVLLWSPETQIIGEYDDWANRNETIRAPSASEPEAGASAPNAARPGIEALRQRLDQLWFRAIGNDLDAEDARELQRLSLAIAVTDRGVRRTHPARNQNRQ
jgi:phosphoglycolate phosphatase-like HAD superfamily hydrolase